MEGQQRLRALVIILAGEGELSSQVKE